MDKSEKTGAIWGTIGDKNIAEGCGNLRFGAIFKNARHAKLRLFTMFFRIYAKTSETNFDVSTPSVGTTFKTRPASLVKIIPGICAAKKSSGVRRDAFQFQFARAAKGWASRWSQRKALA